MEKVSLKEQTRTATDGSTFSSTEQEKNLFLKEREELLESMASSLDQVVGKIPGLHGVEQVAVIWKNKFLRPNDGDKGSSCCSSYYYHTRTSLSLRRELDLETMKKIGFII